MFFSTVRNTSSFFENQNKTASETWKTLQKPKQTQTKKHTHAHVIFTRGNTPPIAS